MPVAIRVDGWLYLDFPALAGMHRRSIELQLQESMHVLGRDVRVFATKDSGDVSVGMTAAMKCRDRLKIGHKKLV